MDYYLFRKGMVFFIVSVLSVGKLLAQVSPIAPLKGFKNITRNNFTITGGPHIHGPLAVGGILGLKGSTADMMMRSEGVDTFIDSEAGDNKHVALIVEGGIDYTSGGLKVLLNNVKIKNLPSHSRLETSNPKRIVKNTDSYGNGPMIELQNNTQSLSSINRDVFDFDAAFQALIEHSNTMRNLPSNTTVDVPNKTFRNTNANVLNVVNISKATLNSLNEIKFSNAPSATYPVIINLDLEGGNFNWNIPNFPGISPSNAQYILWNIYNGGTVYYQGGGNLFGTLYGPTIDFIKTNQSDLEGGIIARNFTLGSGQIHIFPFLAEIPTSCPKPTVSNINICVGETATLTGSCSSGTLNWYTNSNLSTRITNLVVSPSTTTNYYAVCSKSGCTSTPAVLTVQVNNKPTVSVNNAVLNCTANVQTLTATGSGITSYQWSGPNGFSASTASIQVSSPGVYTVNVRNASGCSATAFGTVTQDINTEDFSITGDHLSCIKTSVELTVPLKNNGTYTWTGPNGFTSSGTAATVSIPGDYTATLTLNNGCKTVRTFTVLQDVSVPQFTVSKEDLTCERNTVSVQASGDYTFTWKFNSQMIGTGSSISISAAGLYEVTAVGANGCSKTESVAIRENNSIPQVQINTLELSCGKLDGDLVATGTGIRSYIWEGPNGFTGNSSTINVDQAGVYRLFVESVTGCKDTLETTVMVKNEIPSATVNNATLTCAEPTKTLTANGNNVANYLWIGPNGYSATGGQIQVSVPGKYTLFIESSTGCRNTLEATVYIDTIRPSLRAYYNDIACNEEFTSVEMVSSNGAILNWTVPQGVSNPGNAALLSNALAGEYRVNAIGLNGCTNSVEFEINKKVEPPVPTVNQLDICKGDTVNLVASNCTGSLVWSLDSNQTQIITQLTVQPTQSISYYVACQTQDCKSTVAELHINVIDITLAPQLSSSATDVLKGQEVTLSGTCAQGALSWFSDATFTQSLGLSNSITVHPNVSSTYFATCSILNCFTSNSITIYVDSVDRYFDLALRKVLPENVRDNFIFRGDTTTFYIDVFNQGNVDAQNVRIVDYIPTGFILIDDNWELIGNKAYLKSPIASINVGQSKRLSIQLKVSDTLLNGDYVNYAEIISAQNVFGLEDIDSKYDEIPNNDYFINDDINGNGRNGEDEDDHDGEIVRLIVIEDPEIFDLALNLKLKGGQKNHEIEVDTDNNIVADGGNQGQNGNNTDAEITFVVNVYNQGNVTAKDIVLVNYLPNGLILNDTNWTQIGTKAYLKKPIAVLEGGDSTNVEIKYLIDVNYRGVINNYAEIFKADGGIDVDSAPDDINDDLLEEDDFIDGDGFLGEDEDDHDVESIRIIDQRIFDLALKKVRFNYTSYNYLVPGERYRYYIHIYNQGNVDAKNIRIVDYMPQEFDFVDSSWTFVNGKAYLKDPIPFLAAGDSIRISFDVWTPITLPVGDYTNYAEIYQAENDYNLPDIDSTPDDSNTNDMVGYQDDYIYGDARKGEDEDDHDGETIRLILIKDPVIVDLALNKKLKLPQAIHYQGDTVTFVINVYNQSTETAEEIQLVDYVPNGLELIDSNWTLIGQKAYLKTPIDSLEGGEMTSREITFRIDNNALGTITNAAEIVSIKDGTDVDSTPDDDPNNDIFEFNDFIDGEAAFGEDEDDHDIEEIQVQPRPLFDLAIRKKVKPNQRSLFKPGDKVVFTVEVFNQGNVDATDIQIIDFIPAGLILSDSVNWELQGANAFLKQPIAFLAAGDSTMVEVSFTIAANAGNSITNEAQIFSAKGGVDYDSKPFSSNRVFGVVKDDEIFENGLQGEDDDSHDIANIQLCNSGKCLTATTKVIK